MTREQFEKELTQTIIEWLKRSIYSQDKEDIVQTALLRAWERKEQFRAESCFYTWLYRIVIRTSLNKKKDDSRLCRNAETLEYDDDLDSSHPCIVSNLEASEALSRAYKALDKMDEQAAKAWTIYYTEDVTYQAIADRIGGTVGSNKSRVSRANAEIMRAIG